MQHVQQLHVRAPGVPEGATGRLQSRCFFCRRLQPGTPVGGVGAGKGFPNRQTDRQADRQTGREREREREHSRKTLSQNLSIYIYIYIYIYQFTRSPPLAQLAEQPWITEFFFLAIETWDMIAS